MGPRGRPRVPARHVLEQGDQTDGALYVAGEELAAPQDIERGRRAGSRRRRASGAAWLEPGPAARPPLARVPLQQAPRWRSRGSRACPTGATVAGAHHVAAGDARRRARLGLPVHVDARTRRSRSRRSTGSSWSWEADEFMQFVADLEPNPDGALQIMYGIDGRRDLSESTRDDLSGYAGARPVRIGNGAFDQRQNDVYGAVLDSILLHTKRSQQLPRRLWPIVESQAECSTKAWREPDQGIWEARGKPQHYVSSKLMSWVALDRAAKLAEIRGDPRAGQPRGAGHCRRDQGGHPGARRAATGCSASTTTRMRWTPSTLLAAHLRLSCSSSGATMSRARRTTGARGPSTLEGKYNTKEGLAHRGRRAAPSPHELLGRGATPSSTGPRSSGCAGEDFGELKHWGGISPAWPIHYEDLEPDHTQAEQLYHVHGQRGDDPTDPPASGPYPHPAVSHEPRMQPLSDDFQRLGLRPFHVPLGVQLDEANPRKSRCIRCGTCDGHPCLVHAKSDAEVLGVGQRSSTPTCALLTEPPALALGRASRAGR